MSHIDQPAFRARPLSFLAVIYVVDHYINLALRAGVSLRRNKKTSHWKWLIGPQIMLDIGPATPAAILPVRGEK